MRAVLGELNAGDKRWDGFALHIDLGAFHLPNFGYVAVPIRVVTQPGEGENQIRMTFEARQEQGAFPTFVGSMGVDVVQANSAVLWLGGEYEIPLSLLGALLDRTLLAGVAEKSLNNLVDDIAGAVVARIERKEYDAMRYRLFNRS